MGPCRTGQYHVFYERIFEDLGWENVIVLAGGFDNAYNEMGPTFGQDCWRVIVTNDYMADIRTGIQQMRCTSRSNRPLP